MSNLSPEERRWLNTMSHESEPLQLAIVDRRGEFSILVDDLEQFLLEGGSSTVTLIDQIYQHVREVQVAEAPLWERKEG